MVIIKSERFNTTPALLYKAVQNIAKEEIRDYYNQVVWNEGDKKGTLNYMGVTGGFSVTNASELNISVSVEYPASLVVNENAAGQNIEKLCERLRKKFS